MRKKVKKETFNITVYDQKDDNKEKSIIPYPVRCLIVGSSGCGKTTLLLNFIYKDWVPFKNLYVFSKSLEQDSYKKLQERYKNVEKEINQQISYFYADCEDLIKVDECKQNSLIIFDDCLLENQDIIKEYFVRGRHKNISSIYLSQCYSMVDLRVIRNNLNMIIIFKQNDHYTRKI